MQLEVDAILFDIDGTLVDSTAAVERTWRAWAAAHGADAEEILRVCHGRRAEDTIALFLPAEERAAAVEELERLELDDLADTVALPGSGALLSGLEAGRWAAVTSGPRALMQARLRAAGLPEPAVLVTAEDVAVGKPDPEGYLRAAAALGVDARRCLVIEDAPAGVEAGRAAGAAVLAVATSHDASVLGRADAVVHDLTRCRVGSAGERLGVTVTA
ncbi:HAD-IA family hydrolase [Intrasporangium sp. YIM S08009]|uniref:HAD-IA family hydrolase n=1 Tax=Intrasporangium zincisolvens TaxID=3080018 RepID=UPI002B0522B5|nr:HAD-IA family hydrolase [Intrasporangium sp. YIM S08009]